MKPKLDVEGPLSRVGKTTVTGLQLSEAYFDEFGRDMIARVLPADVVARVCVGLVGEGSECFGFDDEISRDHDFGAGFCLWLTSDDYENYSGMLSEGYNSLPSEFGGYSKRILTAGTGEQRIGVMRAVDFYKRFTGLLYPPQTLAEWRRIPESHLATCTNGKVFSDPLGKFTQWREMLLAYYPEDLRIKKIAARIATMGQAGQYNYPRCIKRGENVAAMIALSEFTQATISSTYLLNKKYTPFYKWAHRGLRDVEILPEVYSLLAKLADGDVNAEGIQDIIEDISNKVRDELVRQGLLSFDEVEIPASAGMTQGFDSDFLLHLAPLLIDRIEDDDLRTLPIFME
jgi:hypothetical protein